MIAEKPTTAYVLSLVGGIFVLLGGFLWAVLGTFVAVFTFGLGVILYIFVIFGALIIYGANKINNDTAARRTWSIIIIVLGAISLFGGKQRSVDSLPSSEAPSPWLGNQAAPHPPQFTRPHLHHPSNLLFFPSTFESINN
jgi:hypothetical protein